MPLISRLNNRSRSLITSFRLKSRHLFDPGMSVDYGPLKLAFSNDGDEQEVQYHASCLPWYEDEMTALAPHIHTGQNIVDIGANIGFYAAIFSHLTGPRGKVLCFEPSRITFEKLKRTIAINQLANVEAFNLGCGNKNSIATLIKTSKSSGTSSIAIGNPLAIDKGSEKVNLVCLDEFLLARRQPIHFLKIDVEGHELFVLKGARDTLRRHKPAIYIELGSKYRESSEASVQFLKDNGYRFVVEPDLRAASVANFVAQPDARH